MPIDFGYFSNHSNFESRYIPDHAKLAEQVRHLKGIGAKIVLTSGTFDLFHIGHALYLEKAKTFGDILVVGVDSDEKVRLRKGPGRPLTPEGERCEILAHQREVDIITLKYADVKKWELIEAVRPDVLIATEGNYSREEIFTLKSHLCGDVVELERQAVTSTSARVRKISVEQAVREAEERIEE